MGLEISIGRIRRMSCIFDEVIGFDVTNGVLRG